MNVFIAILAGFWGVFCVALISVAAGAEWGTIDGFVGSFFGVMAFHVCAFIAYTHRGNNP